MAASPVPLLAVEHLTMRFGGLIAIDDQPTEAHGELLDERAAGTCPSPIIIFSP